MADIKTLVDRSFGYDGNQLGLIDEDTLVYACGNGLKLSSTRNAGEGFVWNQQLASNGVSAFALNVKNNFIAVSEQAAQPGITLYRHPDLEVQAEFAEGTEFEYTAIAFSRSGSRLVGIGGSTDFTVNVWDVDTSTVTAGCEGCAPAKCNAVTFNPRDDSEFCGHGDKGIYFWKVEQQFETHRLVLVKGDAAKRGEARRPQLGGDSNGPPPVVNPLSDPVAAITAAAAEPSEPPLDVAMKALLESDAATPAESRWLCHAWTTDGHIVAGNAAGQLVKFNTVTGLAVSVSRPVPGEGGCVCAVVVSRSAIVVGGSDGTVRWLAAEDLAELKRVVLPAGEPSGTSPPAAFAVRHLAASPSFERLYIGTAGGALFVTTLDSEEEEEAAGGSAALAGPGGALNAIGERSMRGPGAFGLDGSGAGAAAATPTQAAQTVADFHCGPVTGLVPLARTSAGDRLFATAGVDGSLRVYDFGRAQLLGKVWLRGMQPDPTSSSSSPSGSRSLTTLTARAQLPLLAAGDSSGRLHLAVVRRSGKSAASILQLGLRQLHDGVLIAAAFAPTRPQLATVGSDGVLYIVDARCPGAGEGEGAEAAAVAAAAAFLPLAYAQLPRDTPGPAGSTPRRVTWRGDHEVLVGLGDGRMYSLAVPELVGGASSSAAAVPAAAAAALKAGEAASPLAAVLGEGQPHDLTPSLALRCLTPPVTAILINSPSTCVGDSSDTLVGALVTSAVSKEVALYDLAWPAGAGPDDEEAAAQVLPADVAEPTEPLGTLPLHAKGVTCAAAAPHGDSVDDGVVVLATGALDGSICITVMRAGTVTGSSVVRLHSRAVSAVAFSPDGMFVLSAGLDGAVFVVALQTQQLGVVEGTVMGAASKGELETYLLYATATATSSSSSAEEGKEVAFMPVLREVQATAAAAVNEAAKGTYKKELAMLHHRLKDLLAKNERVPELEKLAREEFAVDLVGRQAVVEHSAARALKVRARLEAGNLDAAVVARRVKEECFDSMAVPAKAIHALGGGRVVHNFPIRRKSEAEAARLEKMLLLRRVELREILDSGGERRSWAGLLRELPADVNWIMNAGKLQPVTDPTTLKAAAAAGQEEEGKAEGKAAGGAAGGGDDFDDFGDGEGQGEDASPADVDVTKLGPLQLLYHPAAARSPNQKRVQVALLKELVLAVERRFNEKFEACMKAKEGEVEKIRGKNARVREILGELKEEQDYFRPAWHPDEQPHSVLDVTPEEIGFEKYVTEAERRERAAAAAARAARAADSKDDAPERALQDMMGGTLEAKDELALLEEDLQREPWMDELTEEEMSEEQRKALAEFEAKQKAVMEEKAKQRKALELELKKLKTEVKDLVHHFDARLGELAEERLATLVYTHAQELYMCRLAIGVQEREDGAIREERLLIQLDELCDVRDAAVAANKAFMATFTDFSAQVDALVTEDRQLGSEKHFRSALPGVAGPIDPETYKVLFGLFKQRASGGSGAGAGGVGTDLGTALTSGNGLRRASLRGSRRSMPSMPLGSVGAGLSAGGGGHKRAESNLSAITAGGGKHEDEGHVLDPFAEQDRAQLPAEAKEAMAREAALAPLSLEGDCPDGFDVDEPTWNKLQELRNAKIEMELEIAKQEARQADMERHLQRLGEELDRADEAIGAVEAQRERLLEQRAVSGSNLELLVQLKQGQDEMEAEAVVTDYSDALLLHRQIVRDTNASIVQLGTEKVGTLTSVKDFRKDINKLLWTHKLLDARVRDSEEHYTDLHMLRVTKTLQMFIKGGDIAERQRRDLEKADAKLEHMKKAHQRQLAKHRRAAGKIARQVRDRANENDNLGSQRAELESAVAVRESIHRSRVQAKGGSTDPQAVARARMKAITTRRKLIDLARTQTEEIEFLRQELDRLRQSTFPSFAHASRLAQGNVDEYM